MLEWEGILFDPNEVQLVRFTISTVPRYEEDEEGNEVEVQPDTGTVQIYLKNASYGPLKVNSIRPVDFERFKSLIRRSIKNEK